MIKFAAALLISVTLAQAALAQDSGSSSLSAGSGGLGAGVNTASNTGVMIDITAILNKGFGIGFTRNLSDNISGQIHYSKQTLESDDEDITSSLGSYSAEHRVEEYGVRFDYYIKSVYRDGFYIGAGLKQINLETKVDPIFSDVKTKLEDDTLGAQAYAGYHFRSGASAFKIGLGYGAGGSFSNNLGGTDNKIENDLLLDVSVGVVF